MENKQMKQKLGAKTWILVWVLGLAGQLCWHVENQWFNTFIFTKIGGYSWIISWMTGVSALATTFSTFYFGTLSDRLGKRRPFIFIGYVLWGIFTILFGVSEFLPKNQLIAAAVMVVAMDALMSFFGSMGNDAAFSSWTTDISTEKNRGQIGAVIAALPVIATIAGTLLCGALIDKFDYFTFFIVMGVFVMIIGVAGFFMMKEADGLKPHKDEKGFWHQFFMVFNWKNIKGNKELFLVFLISCVYFISFNFYFTHIGNYFIHTLKFDVMFASILQGLGLGMAILVTIPAIFLINRGKTVSMIIASIILTVVGLVIIGFCGSNWILLFIGIVIAGIGYVLVVQTTTAWMKNLYPEGSHGQYEGIRIIFTVLIPMIIGPTTSGLINDNFGVPFTNEYGIQGMAPTNLLFLLAAAVSVFTIIPTLFAIKQRKKNK